MKMAKCIVELERIYGIKNGGDRKSDRYNVNLVKTQKDLAEQKGYCIIQYPFCSLF